jgi:hypothetical protein
MLIRQAQCGRILNSELILVESRVEHSACYAKIFYTYVFFLGFVMLFLSCNRNWADLASLQHIK